MNLKQREENVYKVNATMVGQITTDYITKKLRKKNRNNMNGISMQFRPNERKRKQKVMGLTGN